MSQQAPLKSLKSEAVLSSSISPIKQEQIHQVYQQSMPKQALVEVDSVSKKYGNTQALNNVSLSIAKGEVLALLGENGAGKTTLIKILLGRLKADNGRVSVFNSSPGALVAKQRIGTVLQETKMPNTLSCNENLELFCSYYPKSMPIDELIRLSGLSGLEDRKFDQLSGGQQQRLFFALAICGYPDLLFLDEPSVGLDAKSRQELWQCIRELSANGVAILLTTHYLEEADVLADRIAVLQSGVISHEGTPEQIKSNLACRIIRFISAKPLTWFSELDGVSEVKKIGQYTQLKCAHVENVLMTILQDVSDIKSLTVTEQSLEDAFLSMTNND